MQRVATIMLALLLAGCGGSPESDEQGGAIEETKAGNAAAPTKANGNDSGKLWVTSERLQRHSCPSEKCGIVGQLFFREAATVLERKGEWARISKSYDASCSGGRSEYVDKGNAECSAANGIVDGKFAEWVRGEHLAANRPPDPAATAAEDEQLVAGSDDFGRYRRAFVTAARALIDDGRCTAGDFEENGGWMKSSNHRDEPVYFTYCGGFTAANRIYLDAASGRIFT
jgi:hypothetical protein